MQVYFFFLLQQHQEPSLTWTSHSVLTFLVWFTFASVVKSGWAYWKELLGSYVSALNSSFQQKAQLSPKLIKIPEF